jgi:hypothetical protein
MENTSIGNIAPLPGDLEKNANIVRAGLQLARSAASNPTVLRGVSSLRSLASNPTLRRGLDLAKGSLVGYSDDALKAMGKLDDVRNVVTRTGWTIPDWNKAITVGGKVIPGKKIMGSGLNHSIKTVGSSLDKWWNPLGWYTGGSEGFNTLKNRFTQGGLIGRGGVAHGTFAANPRLAYNFKDLKAGRRLLPNMNLSYNPLKWDSGSLLGTVGGGVREAGKLGLGVGIPAAAVYGSLNAEEGDTRSTGQRVGGALGSAIGTFASMPLGIMSYLPSAAAPFLTDNKKLLEVADRTTPYGLGTYLGEQVGSLGNRKEFDPEEYQRQKYMQQLLEAQAAQAAQLPPDLARRQYRYNSNVRLPYQSNIYYGRGRLPTAPTNLPQQYLDYRLPPGLNYR